MITNKKLNSVSLASAILILFLIIFSSTASAATTTSNVVGTDYQYWSSEQYPLIDLFGENYVPLCANTDPIWKSHVDKLAKLVIDSKGSHSLMAGENLDLGQGYSLQVMQVDADGEKVWLELDKDGQYVDDQIISTDSGDNTWTCTLNNIQGVNNVPVLKVHVNQIYQGATDSIAQIDGIWLIDYANSRTLNIGYKLGDYTLTTIINGVDASNLGCLVFDYMVTITDLGTLGGDDSSANGINDNGQVVGYTKYQYAFIWQNDIMTDLGTLGGADRFANGINDKGQIVGESDTGTNEHHAFLWQNGVMTDFGTLPDDEISVAYGINNYGQVVGWSGQVMSENSRATLWQNGVITDLGTLPGGSYSFANGINDKGQIVGESWSWIYNGIGYEGRAFLWQNGVITDLGTLGGSESSAHGINDKGQIVGDSSTGTGVHAFLWQNGVMTDLGTLPGGSYSFANGINDKGQVVGYSDTQTGDTHAFLWQNGTMIDLGTLGGSSSRAYGINDKGQIVGESDTQNGASHATLWTLPTSNTKPIAAFSAYPIFGVKPHQVSFKDKSTGSPTSWYWDFGDGNTSIEKNPVNTYYKAGKYSPSLTVGNDIGSDTRTRYNYIVVM